jgi:hypothetical protein
MVGHHLWRRQWQVTFECSFGHKTIQIRLVVDVKNIEIFHLPTEFVLVPEVETHQSLLRERIRSCVELRLDSQQTGDDRKDVNKLQQLTPHFLQKAVFYFLLWFWFLVISK